MADLSRRTQKRRPNTSRVPAPSLCTTYVAGCLAAAAEGTNGGTCTKGEEASQSEQGQLTASAGQSPGAHRGVFHRRGRRGSSVLRDFRARPFRSCTRGSCTLCRGLLISLTV